MKSKYPGVKNGQVEATINKMGGLSMLNCFLSGKLNLEWVVWKTITLGSNNARPGDYPARLESRPCWLGDQFIGKRYVCEALAKIVTISVGKIDLVKLTGTDLGFSGGGVSRAKICNQAMTFGLQMCPWAVAPELVLQFTREEEGEYACIAMEPILGQCVFNVANWWRSVPCRLELAESSDGSMFSTLIPWVFVKPKK